MAARVDRKGVGTVVVVHVLVVAGGCSGGGRHHGTMSAIGSDLAIATPSGLLNAKSEPEVVGVWGYFNFYANVLGSSLGLGHIGHIEQALPGYCTTEPFLKMTTLTKERKGECIRGGE